MLKANEGLERPDIQNSQNWKYDLCAVRLKQTQAD